MTPLGAARRRTGEGCKRRTILRRCKSKTYEAAGAAGCHIVRTGPLDHVALDAGYGLNTRDAMNEVSFFFRSRGGRVL